MNNNEKTRQQYLLCLKELKVGVIATALFISISSIISYLMGYSRDASEVGLVLGFPDWIFWGVLLPWVAIVGFTVFYGMFGMKGDEK